VLLGLAIYGGWFYATQSGSGGIKLIDQVPAYIKNATGIGQTADNNATTTQPEPSKTEAQAAPAPAPAASNLPSSAAPSNTAPATASTADAGTAPAASPPTPPAVVATPAPSATAPAVVLGQGSQSTQATPAPTAPAPATTQAAPAPAAAPTTEQTAAASTTAPAVAPAATVVIRANRDSWIEIRDKDDNVVLQKVLRQGESFNVPEQKGLLMTTGNAGGIVIELEGKPLQSLGSLGVVKRGIKLDPAALSDGSAFQTDDNQ
jgi:cytoskeleton protein RodZ